MIRPAPKALTKFVRDPAVAISLVAGYVAQFAVEGRLIGDRGRDARRLAGAKRYKVPVDDADRALRLALMAAFRAAPGQTGDNR